MKRSNAPLASLAFIVLAIVGIFSAAIPNYRSYEELSAKGRSLEVQVADKKASLAALKAAAESADKDLVIKYLSRFREDKVIELLFDVQRVDFSVADFSLSDAGKTANGLSVGNVTFSPTFKSLAAMRSYMEHLSRADVVISSVTVTREKVGRDEIVRAPMTLAVYYAK